MRVGLIGCVDSSRTALQTLLEVKGLEVAAVVTREQSAVNADFCDLTDLCKKNGIPFHFEDPKLRSESVDFLSPFDLDIIFCIGWSYLLGSSMLTLPKQGVIGFHPAELPSNRGRHPIIWALVLGLKKTASTYFIMDEGADSGPIVSQIPIYIDDEDNATTLYKKIIDASKNQLAKLASELVGGISVSTKQDHNLATYWRKRSRKDGMIDFRMTANAIHNLIRALASPYPGAEFLYKQTSIVVKKSRIAEDSFSLNIEPGKVLDKSVDGLLVKAAEDKAIWLLDIECRDISVGEYL